MKKVLTVLFLVLGFAMIYSQLRWVWSFSDNFEINIKEGTLNLSIRFDGNDYTINRDDLVTYVETSQFNSNMSVQIRRMTV